MVAVAWSSSSQVRRLNLNRTAKALDLMGNLIAGATIELSETPIFLVADAGPHRKGWRPSRRGGARDLVPAGPRGPWARRIVCPGGGLVPRSLYHRSFGRSKTSRWFGDRVLHGRWTPSGVRLEGGAHRYAA